MKSTAWAGALTFLVGTVASTAAAQSSPDPIAEARAVFAQAESDYGAGAFALALERFESAYDLMQGHPRRFMVLFNVARCSEELGRLEVARETYLRVLDEGGRGSEVAEEAHRRIAEIETRRRLDSSPDTPSTSAHPPWIVFGAGAAVAVVGGIILALGLSDAATVDSAAMGTEWSTLQEPFDRSGILPPVGIAALGVGLAAMLGGVVWAVVGGGASTARAQLELHWGLTSLSFQGRF